MLNKSKKLATNFTIRVTFLVLFITTNVRFLAAFNIPIQVLAQSSTTTRLLACSSSIFSIAL